MYILKHHLKTLLFIIFTTGIILIFLIRNRTVIDTRASYFPPEVPTTIPTDIFPSAMEEVVMDSPDGKMTLILKSQKRENYTDYSFFTSDKTDSAVRLIFNKKEISSERITIPYNSWSPDNEYFFIEEFTPGINNYYVFFASGKNFADNQQYLDIQTLFLEKVTGFTITEMTGWAASNLLIVNTKVSEGDEKASFWFDVKSQRFIKLSTYFD